MKSWCTVSMALLAATLCACSLAPPSHTPAVAHPDAYKEAGAWKPAQAEAESMPTAWWTLFSDAQLDELQRRLAADNQDLQSALARYEQARAQAAYARSAYFPALTLQAAATRQQLSENRAQYTGTSPTLYNDHLLRADVSYELDLWGRVRNAAAAARSREQAGAADRAAVELSLRAELATNYFLLRSCDAEQRLLDDAVRAYERALQLTQNRYRGGIAAKADMEQAQVQLAAARAQADDAQLRRAQLEHAIAVLVGTAAADFALPVQPLALTAPPVPAVLPSALLERRPDIAAAQRRVAAANADIGVARAAYFPVFSFGAALGYESERSADWISAPSRLWSLGPSVSWTLFDGGARSARNDEMRAAYDETVAVYRQTVLNAYREVEDSLAAQRLLQRQGDNQTAAAAAARRALFHAEQRYRAGAVTYLEVVVAQNAALQAERAALDVTVRRLNTSVLLIKALGGAWAEPGDSARGQP